MALTKEEKEAAAAAKVQEEAAAAAQLPPAPTGDPTAQLLGADGLPIIVPPGDLAADLAAGGAPLAKPQAAIIVGPNGTITAVIA